MVTLIVVAVLAIVVLVVIARSVRIVPQAQAAVVERLGRYQRTLSPGLALLVPFIDRIRATIDLREQVVSFPPQPVITADNLQVNIDTVIYFQVTDPRAATYGIANFIQAIEQLTVTTLRNVVGSLSLEDALISRDQINSQLRSVLDDTTGTWGVRVARVELKAIEPPPSIQDSMEKQMKADRDKRAIILTAEGQREAAIRTAEGDKQAAILSAEGQKQSAILTAEAERQSRILRAEGERAANFLQAQGQAKAIETVFTAIHDGNPDPRLLAYQYLQTLPQIANGDANKMWIVPSEFSKALEGLSRIGGNGAGEEGASWLAPTAPSEGPRADARPIDTAGWFDSNLRDSVASASAQADVELPAPPSPTPGGREDVPLTQVPSESAPQTARRQAETPGANQPHPAQIPPTPPMPGSQVPLPGAQSPGAPVPQTPPPSRPSAPPPGATGPAPGFPPPPPGTTGPAPGFRPPPPGTTGPAPGFPPPPSTLPDEEEYPEPPPSGPPGDANR